jgi:hypothetical protein
MEMVFLEPDIIEAMLLCPDNLLKGLTVYVCVGTSPLRGITKVVPQTKTQFYISIRIHIHTSWK